jgi:putative endonuclease
VGRWTHDLSRGRRGEDLAHRYLRANGYTIVARNFRTRTGSAEVDLIAWDGPDLVFVEVKSRANEDFGAPDRAVDPQKQKNLISVATEYIRRRGIAWDLVRFDIVSVIFLQRPTIKHIKDAFSRTRSL